MPDQLIPAAAMDAVGAGEWKTLTIAIPDKLKKAREAINTAAEVLIAFLDLIKMALELIKSFLIGYLDPLTAIVKAIMAELQKLVNDIRQLGFYLTSDYKLLKFPFKELRGGFSEYERRMIAKLTDRTDPTRPDLSSLTPTIGIFFYLSVDITAIEKLIRFVEMLMRFFNQGFKLAAALPVPVIKEAKYGSSPGTNIISVDNWKTLTESFQSPAEGQTTLQANAQVPNVARISWVVPQPTLGEPLATFPAPPPGGFLVTVSTLRPGIKLVYDRPRPESSTQSYGSGDKKVQPREHGLVRDRTGEPLVLHGGAELLSLDPRLGFNQGVNDDGSLRDGSCRVYGVPSQGQEQVIPLELLKQGDKHYFQRTFWVGHSETVFSWMTANFTTAFSLKDMPLAADVEITNGKAKLVNERIPYTYYVRVASCSTDALGKFRYVLDQADVRAQGMPPLASNPETLRPSDISAFSDPFAVTFPSANTAEFLKALQTALAVLVLSRSDLTPVEATSLSADDIAAAQKGLKFYDGVALDSTGLERFNFLFERMYAHPAKAFNERDVLPTTFRDQLSRRVRSLALDIYKRLGPQPDMEAQIVQATAHLRTAKWFDLLDKAGESTMGLLIDSPRPAAQQTILGSLDSDANDAGLALNPYGIDLPADVVQGLFTVSHSIRLRKPGFMEKTVGGMNDTSFQPVSKIPAAQIETTLAGMPPSLRMMYEKCRKDKNGDLVVPMKLWPYLAAVAKFGRVEGSADMSPVLYCNTGLSSAKPGTTLDPAQGKGIVFCRSVLLADKELLAQASLALGITMSLKKKDSEGEWLAFRFFDTLPAMEDFLQSLYNWIKAINDAVQSIADAIRKLIDFLVARITEIQQFIRKINDLIQTLLSTIPMLPAASGLILVSSGTGGLLGDLVSAKNKPEDSPLAYGAGLAIVAAVLPGVDLLGLLFNSGNSGEDDLAPLFGTEGIPPAPLPAPDAEPDVL